ncbi:MAG: hypothetical protein ACE5IP_01275 [Terriglobia bacterium]
MKDKRKVILFVALLAVLVGINLPWGSSSAPIAAPQEGSTRASRLAGSSSLTIPDAVLQVERLKPSARVRPGRIQRNIFQYGRRKQAPRRQVQAKPQLDAPPRPPPAPPAPVRFFGFAENSHGGKRQVFLTDGEEIYIAAQGDVILQRYRVVRVGSESIEVEDLSGNHRWVVPLEQP